MIATLAEDLIMTFEIGDNRLDPAFLSLAGVG